MSSKVKIQEANFMDDKNDAESLRIRLREVEDENQELRTRNLLQNRTIIEIRNEIILLRLQVTELADTSALLTERLRILTENSMQGNNDSSIGLITTPPLMAPPPAPPPLPPTRIRICPRQVGAGEALTTPLGASLSSPPRHRIKRDPRQGFYRTTRSFHRRFDAPEPGPSSGNQYFSSERPNYFVGLRIIPPFQTSFVCSQNQTTGYSDSASDSSGSDENPQLFKKLKMKVFDGELSFRKSSPFTRDFELLKNVKNFHHQRVRQSVLQNYNLALPDTSSKFFFSLPWEYKNQNNLTLPSTSNNDARLFVSTSRDRSNQNANNVEVRNSMKISNCVQYTFPTIHEGLHHNGTMSGVGPLRETVRLRKLKKNIPYSSCNFSNKDCSVSKIFKSSKPEISENNEDVYHKLSPAKSQKDSTQDGNRGADSESVSSVDEAAKVQKSKTLLRIEMSSDFEQDGFQADESSNCMTSTENSLEKINVSESNLEKKEEEKRC